MAPKLSVLIRCLAKASDLVVHADQNSGLGRFGVEGADRAGNYSGVYCPIARAEVHVVAFKEYDQCGANIHSTPPPIVQPVLVLEV